ncbi:MAG: hypothetical protein V4665_04410 [Patescibacteria group bacterium]
MRKIKQTLEENKLVMLIVIIFFLLIGYKMISSHIQEKKEKAILQERARLEALAKKPLEDCLKDAYENSIYNDSLEGILGNPLVFKRGMFKNAFETCNTNEANKCVLDYLYQDTLTSKQKMDEFNTTQNELNIGVKNYEEVKDECYRHYK